MCAEKGCFQTNARTIYYIFPPLSLLRSFHHYFHSIHDAAVSFAALLSVVFARGGHFCYCNLSMSYSEPSVPKTLAVRGTDASLMVIDRTERRNGASYHARASELQDVPLFVNDMPVSDTFSSGVERANPKTDVTLDMTGVSDELAFSSCRWKRHK